MNSILKTVILLYVSFLSLNVFGQKRDSVRVSSFRQRMERIDDVSTKRLQRADSVLTSQTALQKFFGSGRLQVDSAYLVRPEGHWTFRVMESLSGNFVRAEGKGGGEGRYVADTKSNYKSTISFGVNYRGLNAILALNPMKLLGKNKDTEVNVNAYGNRFGVDLIYQYANSFTGTMKTPDVKVKISKGEVKQHTFNANAYYVFNYKRFSFPAAFTQSYIQRRSAGSLMLGASFHGMRMKIDAPDRDAGGVTDIKTNNIGLGVGYGYNLVLPHRWMIHLSGVPTLVVWTNNHVYLDDGSRVRLSDKFPQTIFVLRGALMHDFNKRSFCGMTMVANLNNEGRKSHLRIIQNKWRLRMFYGLRF